MVDACLSRHFYRIDQNRTKMATFFATPSPPSTLHFLRSSPLRFPRCLWSGLVRREKLNTIPYRNFVKWNRRRTLICAANQDAENSFRKTVEMDRLIDMLRAADDKELQKLVVENVLSFNESFWIRLAARADNCKSEDDKKDLEELASFLMSLVDSIVHKTYEKIESATDVLKAILRPAAQEEDEIPWPPRDPEALSLMEKELNQREQEGQLDEGFLSEVNAQLRNAKEDGDKPGLEAMLQKVLQLYASRVLSKRSFARKGDEILKAEQFLETIIKAPEEEWNRLLLDGMTVGKGEISPEELYAVVNKRIERTLIRTQGGSYEQRVLVEYLKGIQSRAEEIVQVLQGQG
ncbi:PREDICTED: uncharacterized protein LOC109161862 isoform X1 [Ipomoea nil]|uniref:uncharacterized protein LOC109161862 isoform X1 n=1 Tax=Ipomoea nil TaxID=35883 RepID=UPI000900BE3D|nr:PREDICTED: uncharacterized protein LOC109161862 isoform X1 [Ipomoea nil]